MAQVVYTRAAANSEIRGDLFNGLKFFVAQRCPSRTTYVDKVVSNGGQVVKLETQADLLIADDIKTHLNPSGAISFKFIDDSIRTGTLANAEDDKYRAGPALGSSRPVGSIRPGRVGRTPFTLEDKIELYEFVKPHADKGGSVRGNEIYKQLERINNRHTFQAWRDHYIKFLDGRPHPGNANAVAVQNTGPPTPPVDRPDQDQTADNEDLYEAPEPPSRPPMTTAQARRAQRDTAQPERPSKVLKAPGFTAVDLHDLLANADDVLDTRVRHEAKAWEEWSKLMAENAPKDAYKFSGEEWKKFWVEVVRPLYAEHEDDDRRIKIYNTSWLAWTDINKEATADDWLDYYDLVVRPLFDVEDQDLGATPAKKGSSQIFGARGGSPDGKEDNAVVDDVTNSASKKRDLPLERTEDDPRSPDSTRKRIRLQQERIIEHIPGFTTGEDEPDVDAALRAYVNISDDEADHEQVETDRQSKAYQQQQPSTHVPLSSPPLVAAENNDKGRAFQDTQAIMAESQFIDFDVPEPEGGFDSALLYPDLAGHEALTASQADPLGSELAAQATAAAEAEDAEAAGPSLERPDANRSEPVERGGQESAPDNGYVTTPETQTSATPVLTTAEAEYPSLAERATMLNIQALADSGRDTTMIWEAATRTSADPKLFRIVLRSLENGRGVPKRTKGVWTVEDDEIVEGTDARKLQALEAKHGTSGLHSIEGRLGFLREWRSDAE